MSGIAGVVHLDGALVDPAFLEPWLSALAFRGPDAQRAWHEGPAGFVHTLLRTTRESESERQPFTLDCATITADARMDAREDLIAALDACGRRVAGDAPDGELILHAWHAWGEACVEHLLGDFAFAVWDARTQRLFCARDHFGIKPFYYVRTERRILFSNTLNALKLDPAVSDRLNDRAVVDFLVEGYNRDLATTLFADIQRLPPAHTLVAGKDEFRLRRYWAPSEGEPLRFRRREEYVEQFLDLLRRAVRDRLRVPRAAIHMSGGLDSCSVAAVASNLPPTERAELCALTLVSEKLVPDEERDFGGLAAQSLGIPIEFLDVDPFPPYFRGDDSESLPPEPLHEPFHAVLLEQFERTARISRVALTGQGGDPAFSTSVTHYARTLLRGGRLGRLLVDFGRFALAEGRWQRLYLGRRMRLLRARRQPPPSLPPWLRASLAESASPPSPLFLDPNAGRGLRPTAVLSFSAPIWAYHFELYDSGVTRAPVECRNPYFDLRLVDFLLRLPPVPWCTDKELVRVAMHGLLPEKIRLRPKTPLGVDPLQVFLEQPIQRWWRTVPPDPQIQEYIVWEKVAGAANGKTANPWMDLAPVSLNLWLTARRKLSGSARKSEPAETPC